MNFAGNLVVARCEVFGASRPSLRDCGLVEQREQRERAMMRSARTSMHTGVDV